MAGCFPEKPRRCLSEQVCQGSKVWSALNGPEDWILRYIRTCLLIVDDRLRKFRFLPLTTHWPLLTHWLVKAEARTPLVVGSINSASLLYITPYLRPSTHPTPLALGDTLVSSWPLGKPNTSTLIKTQPSGLGSSWRELPPQAVQPLIKGGWQLVISSQSWLTPWFPQGCVCYLPFLLPTSWWVVVSALQTKTFQAPVHHLATNKQVI